MSGPHAWMLLAEMLAPAPPASTRHRLPPPRRCTGALGAESRLSEKGGHVSGTVPPCLEDEGWLGLRAALDKQTHQKRGREGGGEL